MCRSAIGLTRKSIAVTISCLIERPVSENILCSGDARTGVWIMVPLETLQSRSDLANEPTATSGVRLYILHWVIDISEPLNAHEVASCELPERPRDVQVSGPYAYVADGDSGLRVIDVSAPTSPLEVGHCDTPGLARDICVSGSYAYVAGDKFGLRVIDVATPQSPQEVGFCDTPGSAYGVDVLGSYAYVADYDSGLRVIDISSPPSPQEVGVCHVSTWSSSISVCGSYAYVVSGIPGVRVIDISVPTNPQEIGYYNPAPLALNVYAFGSRAYVTGTWGLRVADVTIPANPQEIGYYYTPYNCNDARVCGSRAYVSSDAFGLQIYEDLTVGVQESRNLGLDSPIQVLRNPILGDCIELRISLVGVRDITFDLYNIAGQQVRSFPLGELSQGEHHITLPATGFPSGLYFLRLKDDCENHSVKIALLTF